MVSFCQRIRIEVANETDARRPSTTKIDLLKRDEVRDFQLPTGIREMINEKFKIDSSEEIRSCLVDREEIEPDNEILRILKENFSGYEISYAFSDRYLHSFGRSSPEILSLLNGGKLKPFAAVLYPDSTNVQDLMPLLKKNKIKAAVSGGGTSVTAPFLFMDLTGIVCIDTLHLDEIEIGKNYVKAGSGVRGIDLESKLNSSGRTCGHFPESMFHSTVGGWVSTKSSGQESNFYGDIEDILIGVRIERSDGEISDGVYPRESAGIDGKSIAIGSEGKTGLITEVILKTFKIPENRYYESRLFHSFKEGLDFLEDQSKYPAVIRLSDETETEYLLRSTEDSRGKRILFSYAKTRGMKLPGSSLLILVGNEKISLNGKAGIKLGSAISHMWERNRYGRPEIGNALWGLGLVPDTMETSCRWEDAYSLYKETIGTFQRETRSKNIHGVIMCHASHMYRLGPALYFTFITDVKEYEDLLSIRNSISETFSSCNGAITHHHGIGSLFMPMNNAMKAKIMNNLIDPVLSGSEHD